MAQVAGAIRYMRRNLRLVVSIVLLLILFLFAFVDASLSTSTTPIPVGARQSGPIVGVSLWHRQPGA